MRHTEISVLDDNEEEFITLLQNFGMNRSMARILICITLRGEISGREIEIAAGIKSSTVSVMLKKLREDGIVAVSRKRDAGRSRDISYYRLAGSIDDILNLLERKKNAETASYIDRINKIKVKPPYKDHSHR